MPSFSVAQRGNRRSAQWAASALRSGVATAWAWSVNQDAVSRPPPVVMLDKTSGKIEFHGEEIGAVPAKQFAMHPTRKRIQMVFQDPTDSLNPRFTARRAIADPLIRLDGSKKC